MAKVTHKTTYGSSSMTLSRLGKIRITLFTFSKRVTKETLQHGLGACQLFSTFEELADKFMSQYSYLSGKKPTITDLQDTIQGANENVQSFVSRFRELLVKTEIVIPEPHFFLLFESSLPSLYQSSA